MRANLRRYSSWIWLLGSLIVVAVLSTITAGQPAQAPPLSARSPQPEGALALYLWLERAGYQVRRDHGTTVGGLPTTRSTMMILTPQRVSETQAREVLHWTRRGGRTVLAGYGDSNNPLLAALELRLVPIDRARVHIVQPLLLSPPASQLYADTDTVLAGIPPGAVVATTDLGPALLYVPYGSGAFWVLTSPNVLDNAHIASGDNRRLALNLAGSRGTSVAFEEFSKGSSPSGSGWLTTSVWGVAFLFVLFVLLLYRWLSGWRLGPPLPSPTTRLRPASEYVVSLANLLQRARRRRDVLTIYRRGLRRAIADRYGTEDLSHLQSAQRAEVERLLTSGDRPSEDALIQQIAAIVECEENVRARRV